MQGPNAYQEKLFLIISLREMTLENHLLIKIDNILNLDFIYKLTKKLYCNDNGRPSIDFTIFFRMQIINYLYGISSDRQLCEEIHFNIAYRCFCRFNLKDKVPNHSSLTKIRAYIPLHEDNLGEGKLSRKEFKYERKEDRYRCPVGNYLYPYEKMDGATTKRY